MNKALETLKVQVSRIPPKQQSIFEQWLHTWSTYIKNEREFDPTRLRTYKRGEIVHLHLGYNVGSEEGGPRYAVVVENDNARRSKVVVIVPLSTLENNQSKDSLHHSEVYLGKIIPGSDKESYALPLHIRGISKMRIIKPRRDEHGVYKISPEKLTEIDDKIKILFTHKKPLDIE
jgi:mRNA-degrading endonuclease toxin of MazEF toxin-antitoxin module